MEFINIEHRPQLRDLADYIRKTKRVIILRDEKGEDIATITPAQPKRRRLPKGKPLAEDDAILGLIGIGDSGQTDISSNKHKYLAEAYLSHRK
jgi:hypothetical protein